jgi:predicted metal-dependent peptidase
MNAGEKLSQARCRLMLREPWYGHMAMLVEWVPRDMSDCPPELQTMGVRVMSSGHCQCVYHPPFVDTLSVEQLYGVVMHELEHLIRVHCIRRTDHHHPLAWNIAADMCVNGTKRNPRIGYKDPSTNKTVFPLGEDKLVTIPEDWPDNETTEFYYDKLIENSPPPQPSSGGDGEGPEGKGQGQSQDSCKGKPGRGKPGDQKKPGGSNPYDKNTLDNHDLWQESEVSDDEARQVVKSLTDQATGAHPGSVPGHLQGALDALGKPVVRWRELLRRYMGNHIGNRRVTFNRRNRRRDEFGIPGVSHRAAAAVSVVVDTSGSVSDEKIKNFFGEIESVTSRAKVSVLQWDHGYQGFKPAYRRGDWKKIKIGGRGGTDMNAPVQWLKQHGVVHDVMIMFTDGEVSGWPEKQPFPAIFVIANRHEVKKPEWGNTVLVTNAD